MKALRIWFACSFGLALSMVFGLDFGFLAILLPMFVLGNTDKFHLPMLIMVLISAIWTTIQMSLVWDLFKIYPFILVVLVGLVFVFKCLAMTKKTTFLVGYMGLIVGSIILNFSSYTFMDIEEMSITIWVYCALNIVICAIAYWLFPATPEAEQDQGDTGQSTVVYEKGQIFMVWFMAMLAFLTFQLLDLYDSASAHASILVILAPMTFTGALLMAKVRIVGTAIGCLLGLAMQLVLGLWFENAFLYWLLFTIAMGPLCLWQTQGKAKAAISFSAMAALSVPMTSALSPGEKDAFFAILYRFSSIFVAVVLSAVVIFLIQKLFETRHTSLASPEGSQ